MGQLRHVVGPSKTPTQSESVATTTHPVRLHTDQDFPPRAVGAANLRTELLRPIERRGPLPRDRHDSRHIARADRQHNRRFWRQATYQFLVLPNRSRDMQGLVVRGSPGWKPVMPLATATSGIRDDTLLQSEETATSAKLESFSRNDTMLQEVHTVVLDSARMQRRIECFLFLKPLTPLANSSRTLNPDPICPHMILLAAERRTWQVGSFIKCRSRQGRPGASTHSRCCTIEAHASLFSTWQMVQTDPSSSIALHQAEPVSRYLMPSQGDSLNGF